MASWKGQTGDTLLSFDTTYSDGLHVIFELDKLADGRYRITVGNLFQFREVGPLHDLEGALRLCQRLKEHRSSAKAKALLDAADAEVCA